MPYGPRYLTLPEAVNLHPSKSFVECSPDDGGWCVVRDGRCGSLTGIARALPVLTLYGMTAFYFIKQAELFSLSVPRGLQCSIIETSPSRLSVCKYAW
jgi:hypothetical protein